MECPKWNVPSDCCGSTKPNNKHNYNSNFNLIANPIGLIDRGSQHNIRGRLILIIFFEN